MKLLIASLFIFLLSCAQTPSSEELKIAESEFNEALLTGTGPIGSCDNEIDRTTMRSDNHAFAERWNDLSGINGLDEQTLQADFPSMSNACIKCVGDLTKCAVNRCGIGMCDSIFGYGAKHLKCRECTRNACGAPMIKCSGLLPHEWPDFDRGDL